MKKIKKNYPTKSTAELEKISDFISIRHLHSEQAKKLVTRKWKNPIDSSDIYLIEDSELRLSYGELIGKIAASHHWDIEDLSEIRNQINAISSLPKKWRINGQKLACILRCADAAHIDSERAPTFLFALYKRNGVSFNHWLGQNKMAQVDIYEKDSSKETLLFTSTSSFNEDESDAWWVIYDALTLFSKELNSSNTFLESNFGEDLVFRAKRVYGLESLEILSSVITVNDWTPNSTELHVGNIERLIENLGGSKLYTQKDKFMVGVRELIQNSADAIRARRSLDNNFVGKIIIELDSNELGTILRIKDDGVGMSKRVLTGPLLDFGTSFWSSSLIKDEYPGLLAKEYRSVGQFGIGFYSIFMIADSVSVTSKRYDASFDSVLSLNFKNGLSLRPLLKKDDRISDGVNTIVSIQLKKGVLISFENIEIKSNPPLNPDFKVPIELYLGSIFPGLDIDVYLVNHGKQTKIHTSVKSEKFNLHEWFKRLTFCEYHPNKELSKYVDDNFQRLEIIREGNQIVGIAALSTILDNGCTYLNNRTIGGLTVNVHERRSYLFVGFLDHLPTFANRTANKIGITKKAMDVWIKSQKSKLISSKIDPVTRISVMSNLVGLNYDAFDYFGITVILDNNLIYIMEKELFDLIKKKGVVFFITYSCNNLGCYFDVTKYKDYILYKPILKGGSIHSIELGKNNIPKKGNNILGYIERLAEKNGIQLNWSLSKDIINSSLETYRPLICEIKN